MRAATVSFACVLSVWARQACAMADAQATQPAQPIATYPRTENAQAPQTFPNTGAPTPADLPAPRRLSETSLFARDRNISVAERPHPEYAGVGMAAGPLVVEPEVTVSATYDDNVRGSPGGGAADLAAGVAPPQSDVAFRASPAVHATLNEGRYEVTGLAALTRIEYTRFSRLDSTDFEVRGDANYHLSPFSELTADVQTGRFTIPFTNLVVPRDALSSEWYDLVGADVGGRQETGRLRFSEHLSADQFNYNNPAIAAGGLSSASAPQSEQNHWTYRAEGKAELALTPTASVFLAAQWNQRDYAHPGPIGVNADGFQVTAGASFDLTHLVRGEAQIGALDERFHPVAGGKTNFAKGTTGPAFRGKIEWFPTQLTTVTASGSREFEDYTIAGAQATLETRGGLRVDHEIRRNLIAGAAFNYQDDQYIGVNGTNKSYTGNIHVNYLLNRHLAIESNYDHVDQHSSTIISGIGMNFSDNQIRVGLRLQY